MKPNFSVVVCAKNEEERIPRLLSSLKEFISLGGEVIVGDGGSTDLTKKICKDAGCLVYDRGIDNFFTVSTSEAEFLNSIVEKGNLFNPGDTICDSGSLRNLLASHASNDMVLNPDADEVCSQLDVYRINYVLGKYNPARIFNDFVHLEDGAGKSLMELKICKFWNRKKAQYIGFAHEAIFGGDKDVVLDRNTLLLKHYQDFSKDRITYVLKYLIYELYYNCINKDLVRLNKANIHFYLGKTLMFAGHNHSARRQFEIYLEMKNTSNHQRAMAMCFLGVLSESFETSKSYYERAFKEDPTKREPLLRLAIYYKSIRNPEMAFIYANAALNIPFENHYIEYNMQGYREIPHDIMMWSLYNMGRKDEAKQHWLKCMEYMPEFYKKEAKHFL